MNPFFYSFFMLIIGYGIWTYQISHKVFYPKLELRLSSVTYGTDPNAEKWYEYNDSGDLVRQALSIDTIEYKYTNQKIVKSHIDKKLNWLSTVEYSTDQNGRVTNSVLFDENDKEISRYKFEYDAEGFLHKTVQYIVTSNATYINDFVYQDGDLKEILNYDMKGNYSGKYVFDYDLKRPNVFNLNMHHVIDDVLPNDRLGRMNKHMIRQMANISKEGDTLSLLKYKFDPLTKGKLKEYQSDVLNEFDTEVVYHFTEIIK